MEFLDLPDSLLLNILTYLDPTSIARAGKCCSKLCRIAQDDLLWKRKFSNHFNIPINFPQRPGLETWREEYIRLVDEIPSVETQVISHHSDEIWFVSFSKSGNRFVTCSKDATFAVWNSAHEQIYLEFSEDMRFHNWEWCWYPEFNCSDTFLLISGVKPRSFGEIAIFDLFGGGRLLFKVPNNSYSVSGTWLSENSFISATCHQETFFDLNQQILLNELPYNGPSFQSNNLLQKSSSSSSLQTKLLYQFRRISLGRVLKAKFNISSECLEQAKKKADQNLNFDLLSRDLDENSENNYPDFLYTLDYVQNKQQKNENQVNSNHHNNQVDTWLVFACGTHFHMEHEVGFKRMKLFSENEKFESTETQKQEFDEVDLVMNFHGFVVGLTLSPDDEYLYVNCRPWPSNYSIDEPFAPPDISQDTDIHVIHLPTLSRVGMTRRIHNVYLSDPSAHIYIYIRASLLYFGSGSSGYGGPVRDQNGYLWDRHYGLVLAKLPHEGHVSCLDFKEQDPQMLVSVSHDKKIRIWRSRSQCRRLKIEEATLKKAIKMVPRSQTDSKLANLYNVIISI